MEGRGREGLFPRGERNLTVTHNELILEAYAARLRGEHKEAERLDAIRWTRAMGTIVNSENTRKPTK